MVQHYTADSSGAKAVKLQYAGRRFSGTHSKLICAANSCATRDTNIAGDLLMALIRKMLGS